MASSSSQAKKKKKKHKEKKKQRREGAYLSSLTSTFGMKRSSCLLLSMFLQRWDLHLPQAMCHEALCNSSSGVLLSSWDGVSMKCGEEGRRGEVGRRGKFWGREGGWKIPVPGKRMGFWFIPKTAWTASSSTGALLAAGSLQPKNLTLNRQLLPSKQCTRPTPVYTQHPPVHYPSMETCSDPVVEGTIREWTNFHRVRYSPNPSIFHLWR